MNTLIPINVMKMIESINQKINLPNKIKLIGYEPELCLWNCAVIQRPIIETTSDHIRAMKLAWLAQGNVGLLNYIEQYIKKERLHRVRAIILSIK